MANLEELERIANKVDRLGTVSDFMDGAPFPVVIVDEDGVIVVFNRQAEFMTGYHKDSVLGQKVELLVPERFRSQHPIYRARYLKNPQPRPMGGTNLSLYMLRKDGTEIPVSISLNSRMTSEGAFTFTIIQERTEHKEQTGSSHGG